MNQIYEIYNQKKKKNDELIHYGVPGMKWGVHKAIQIAGGISNHGKNQLNKKSQLYAIKSNRHKNDGHKIRSAYYKHKSNKTQDKMYDDTETFMTGLRDISIKANTTIALAKSGKKVVEKVLSSNRKNKPNYLLEYDGGMSWYYDRRK